MIQLIRVDAERNLNRWYVVAVQATLFDQVAVICGWGRRGSDYARWRIVPVENVQQGAVLAARIVAAKRRHGYLPGDE